ncbi:UNVERIFIED_CONTAM: hypothetical protein Sradi_2633000 [Sesamum radiatum]|uniref:SWIM-type domain-containing protein n=1 Tax=Sesamum radiatum TaxID=300843 RepID=A0AAW2S4Y9_SESRA
MTLLATPGLPSCSNTDYLATPGLPSCSNTDYLAGTSNPDFGAGTSNPDFSAEDPIGDSFANESDDASEPDETEYPIPPEDGLNDVDINIMVETFAQGMAETSSEPAMPNRTTQPIFYRSILFFEQIFPEIPADFVDVPNLGYAKFYNKFEGRLDVGMLFKIKEELMEAVQDHSIRHVRREYYVSESSRTKWRVLCKHSTEGHVKCNPSYGNKHIIQNVKDQTGYDVPYQKACNVKNMVLKDLCWQAGSEYPLRKFNRIMEKIKKQHVGAFAYLDQINKEKWTTSHDGGWRCSILTINMSECINGVLKGACRLSVRALVEITLERTVHYFRVRVINGHKMLQNNQLWTGFAYKMFISWRKKAVEHTVMKYSHSQQSASVVTRRQNGHGINTHVVKIANRECSCGKWNQFGIPCSHAQKVCGAYNISVASMVNDYYDLMAYNNTYSKHFEPVHSEDYWDDPNFQLVHDPTIRISTRPGQNQTIRIHNEMDWRQTRARQEAQQQRDSSIQENMPEEDC